MQARHKESLFNGKLHKGTLEKYENTEFLENLQKTLNLKAFLCQLLKLIHVFIFLEIFEILSIPLE